MVTGTATQPSATGAGTGAGTGTARRETTVAADCPRGRESFILPWPSAVTLRSRPTAQDADDRTRNLLIPTRRPPGASAPSFVVKGSAERHAMKLFLIIVAGIVGAVLILSLL